MNGIVCIHAQGKQKVEESTAFAMRTQSVESRAIRVRSESTWTQRRRAV
jgi:hypothetical protein